MTFGKMPLSNGFLNQKDFNSEFFYEMSVGFSKKISLFQLNELPNPKKIFNKKYPFYTGSSEYMKIHFKKYRKLKTFYFWLNKHVRTATRVPVPEAWGFAGIRIAVPHLHPPASVTLRTSTKWAGWLRIRWKYRCPSGASKRITSGSKPNASASSPSIRAMLPSWTTVYVPPSACVSVTKVPSGIVVGVPVGTSLASTVLFKGTSLRSTD